MRLASTASPLRLAGPGLAVLLSLLVGLAVPTSRAQDADSDGDGVPNALELGGYRFEVLSGGLVACVPGEDDPCYVTDPLSWSSDGDPYSDYQEASGVNMDATVGVPYNSPLVAAYPVIEVALDRYTFTANAEITDSDGGRLERGEAFTSSVETTQSTSVTAKVESSFPGGVSASAEATESYSRTRSYSATTSQESEINWASARTTQLDDAGTLSLSVLARNTGGATALNVRPTFNVYLGDDLVATVLPDVPFRQSLAPGEASAPVVPLVGGEPLALTLTFERLKALQTGAPVTIEVVDILADIQRWRPQDSNWECGSGETCSWTSFQNQILPRTLRLLVDFGYSGDPNADVPFRFRGNPFEYRVYTGSPNSDPGFTLRDVLRIVEYELDEAGGTLAVEGRPYPDAWLLTAQADEDGYSAILEAWEAAGEPDDLMDLVMPTRATLLMASPDPEDAGPVIASVAFTPDLLGLRVTATPKGSLPVVAAEAHVVQYGETRTVPLVPLPDGTTWTTEGTGAEPFLVPAGAAGTYVTVTDRSGAVRRADGPFDLPFRRAASCAEVPDDDLLPLPIYDEGAVVFPSGDLDVPVEVFCDREAERTLYWIPQTTDLGNLGLYGAAFVDARTAVVVGNTVILRSTDGGRTWARQNVQPVLWDVARRPDTGTLVAVGGGDPAVMLRSTDDGQTWTAAEPGTSRTMYAVDHAAGDVWWAVGEDRIMVSYDDGRAWVGAPTDPGFTGGRVGVAFRDALTGIVLDTGTSAGGTGRTWRTTDGGVTWENVFTATGVTDVTYAGEGAWYVTQRTPGGTVNVLRSREDGVGGSWEVLPLAGTGSEHPRSVAFVTPELGFVADNEGILRTDDGGETWTMDLRRRPYGQPRAVAVYDANRGLAAGTSGLVQLTTSGGIGAPVVTPTAVDPAAPERPDALALAPNYPNPFRGRTTLAYTLQAPERVTLTVYDLLGREVARLVDAPQAAGRHTVVFDADGLAAGLYLARLRAGDQTAVRRLVHLR